MTSNLKTYSNIAITIFINSFNSINFTLKTPTIRFKETASFITFISIPNIFKRHKIKRLNIIKVLFKGLHISRSSSTPSSKHTSSISTSSHSRFSNIHKSIKVFHSGNLFYFNFNSILTDSTIWIISCTNANKSRTPRLVGFNTVRKLITKTKVRLNRTKNTTNKGCRFFIKFKIINSKVCKTTCLCKIFFINSNMNNYFTTFTINSICTISSHHIRKTTTTSFIYKKMKTILFSKFHYMKSPKLSIKEFRKIIMFLSSISITTINSTFIKLFHSNIIKKIIMRTCNANIMNSTIRVLKTRSTKTVFTSMLFSSTKLSMRNRIYFIRSILTFMSTKIISHFIK